MCSSVDWDCARSGATKSASQTAGLKACATSARTPHLARRTAHLSLRLSLARVRFPDSFARVERSLIFLVREVVPGNPRKPHLVDRPLPAAHPVARIGVALARRVVVPRDHVEHGP